MTSTVHRGEFDNDCTQITYIGGLVNRPPERTRVFSIEGLILLCMFSEQQKARRFRAWLLKIGKQVLVEGYYTSP